jgi:hypothetical protein
VGLFVSGGVYVALMKGMPLADSSSRAEPVPEAEGD